MLAAAFLSYPSFVLAFFGLVALAAGLWIYFKGATGQALLHQQDFTLHQQEAAIQAQQVRLDDQDKKIEALVKQNEDQAEQIKLLREMVTQTAKVDKLIGIVHAGFTQLGAKIADA